MLHAIYERIVVTGRMIVSIRLTPSAHAHGLAVVWAGTGLARNAGQAGRRGRRGLGLSAASRLGSEGPIVRRLPGARALRARLLACDFDGPCWVLDAVAYVDAAHAADVYATGQM